MRTTTGIEKAKAMSDDEDIESLTSIYSLEDAINRLRRKEIIKQLRLNKGNISKTAKALGYKNHHSLIYWIEKLGINPDDFKKE